MARTERLLAVCPVIAEFVRTLDDGCDDADVALLAPVIAQVVDTAGDRRTRRARRALCRRRALALRAPATLADRWCLALLADRSAAVCAATFLERASAAEAVAFVLDELVAVVPPVRARRAAGPARLVRRAARRAAPSRPRAAATARRHARADSPSH